MRATLLSAWHTLLPRSQLPGIIRRLRILSHIHGETCADDAFNFLSVAMAKAYKVVRKTCRLSQVNFSQTIIRPAKRFSKRAVGEVLVLRESMHLEMELTTD
jgi:hypothetical protein